MILISKRMELKKINRKTRGIVSIIEEILKYGCELIMQTAMWSVYYMNEK